MALIPLIKEEVKNLFPAYFALVMSTGIISIAAHLLNFHFISEILFWGNNLFFLVLFVMLLARIIFFFPYFFSNLNSHITGAGYFTLIAGITILGVQFVLLKEAFQIATILWYVSLVLWIVLIYTFFVIVTVRKDKPALEKGINGIWLVIIVATQGVSILGTLLASHLPFPAERVLFLTLCGFLLGCMLYVILITLIFYRLTFFPIRAEEFAPPFWINMGAVAITTLSGSTLILNINNTPGLSAFIPFLKGFTLFFWATGTWWIPIIVILGIWRHVYNKFPLSYHPQYWGMVFPLGMYTVCTWRLSQALNLAYLKYIPLVFIYVAFIAWLAAFTGLVLNLIKTGKSLKK